MTRYERTKLYRQRYPAKRSGERSRHYKKYAYGQPHRRHPYTHDEVVLVLTKTMNGMTRPDRIIAKVLHRSLKAIHVYRCHLLSKTPSDKVAKRWRVLAKQLQKEGRVWQKP